MDRWIILSREERASKRWPVEHTALANAETELARLSAAFPQKTFRIFRCKSHLEPSQLYDQLVAFVAAIADNADVPDIVRAQANALVRRDVVTPVSEEPRLTDRAR